MNNQRLIALGARIKEAQARVEAMQQQIQTILEEKEMEDRCSKCNHRCNEDCAHPEKTDADYGLEPIEADYRETAEDTGTVKYTADGLYDYGYNPIDEDIPF